MLNVHRAYRQDVARELSQSTALSCVAERELDALPALVQRYLRLAGAVGRPRVANFRVRMHGRIRSAANAKWMPLRAEQYDFVAERKRFFYLRSSMFGVPVRGYHRYAEHAASMDIKAAVIPVVRAGGDELFQSETVTLLNDLCLFAPGALVDPAFGWQAIDAHSVEIKWANHGVAVRARLLFNEAGELADFVSDDRYQASADGRRMTRQRWSTPVWRYRAYGPMHLMAAGEGRWHTSDRSFAYVELEVDDIEHNVGRQ